MDTVRVAYRDDDRTPVIYCIKEMGAKHYGIDVEVLKIKDYGEFEASLFNDSADVLIDHVEFLYAEATKGKKITFFCAPRIVRGLDLMVPKHVESADDSGGAKESNFFSFGCLGVKKFHVIDQHIGCIVEQ